MRKRIMALFLPIAITLTMLCTEAHALSGIDGHWAGEYAQQLNKMGIFHGDDKGNANLDDSIKRAEFLALLVRGMFKETDITEGVKSFTDVKYGTWYYDIASLAKQKGIVQGDENGNLIPEGLITREHIVLMMTRAYKLEHSGEAAASFSDISENYEYYTELMAAVESGFISGYDDGSFGAKRSATRGETLAMIGRMLGVEVTPPPTPEPPAVTEPPVVIEPAEPVPPDVTDIPNINTDGYINLTWHNVYSSTIESPGEYMQGLNVVSPTWFRIRSLGADEAPKSYEHKLKGDNPYYLQDVASRKYVENSHNQGYKVWALFKSNDFSANNNSRFLNDANATDSAIALMRDMIIKYDLDGINMDFENILPSDKDAYTSFVKRMYAVTQELGVVLSVDVTKYLPAGGSWSMGYDRTELAKNSDYIALMAYDQNGTSSSKAGSVGDMPWVENAIKISLDEIPAEKLILGVPFYTRLWQSQNGKVIKTSAISINSGLQRVAEAGASIVYDEKTGQNYATWTQNGVKFEIWLEDNTSMLNRINLMKKYGLAGIASWSKEFSNPDMWKFIDENLD